MAMAILRSQERDFLERAKSRIGNSLCNKYHIDDVLGVGGTATVYATTHRNRRRFAVKVLHPELSYDMDIRSRFVREGFIANSVGHPGVVSILDDDTDKDGTVFMVMELLEGVSIDRLCYPPYGPMPVGITLEICCQLLDILEAAHKKGIVHRDVKPANVFLTTAGKTKLLDFGISRVHGKIRSLLNIHEDTRLGTPAFMAPEQASAINREVDARTDIWSLGATLFTMLSGQHVHNGDSAIEIMIKAATEAIHPLENTMRCIPADVVDIINRACEFEKQFRYQSAEQMKDAVKSAQKTLVEKCTEKDLSCYLKQEYQKHGIKTARSLPEQVNFDESIMTIRCREVLERRA